MTKKGLRGIIIKHDYGGIAQLARATGSYPVGHGFKSNSRYQRPVGQEVKTPPFHGSNSSSILLRVTRKKALAEASAFFNSRLRVDSIHACGVIER